VEGNRDPTRATVNGGRSAAPASVREGFQALEHAELAQHRGQSGGSGERMYATRLGLKALATGNVRDYLSQSTAA
jgi:hypothetical protein